MLVATDGAIAALGEDGRRLRPNIVLSGVPGLAERTWPGSALRIGDALVGVQSVRGRCIVTTIDPDTGAQDLDVLRKIHRQFDGTMAPQPNENESIPSGGVDAVVLCVHPGDLDYPRCSAGCRTRRYHRPNRVAVRVVADERARRVGEHHAVRERVP